MKKAVLTAHAQFLSLDEGVYLRKSKSLGRYIYKAF